MIFDKLLDMIKSLMARKWTGQIRINFYKGEIAAKIERKDSTTLTE